MFLRNFFIFSTTVLLISLPLDIANAKAPIEDHRGFVAFHYQVTPVHYDYRYNNRYYRGYGYQYDPYYGYNRYYNDRYYNRYDNYDAADAFFGIVLPLIIESSRSEKRDHNKRYNKYNKHRRY